MSNFEQEFELLSQEEKIAKFKAILASYDLCYFLRNAQELEDSDLKLELLFFEKGREWLLEHGERVFPNIQTLRFNDFEIDREEEEGLEGGEVKSIEELEEWVRENFSFVNNFEYDPSDEIDNFENIYN